MFRKNFILSKLSCRAYVVRPVEPKCHNTGVTKHITKKLTPLSRGLPENLTAPHLVRNFPAFYGTRRFITVFTKARHLSLSQVRSIHSTNPSHFSKIHFNIILSSTPGSSKWSPSFKSPHRNPVCTSPLPIRATCSAHLNLFYHPSDIW